MPREHTHVGYLLTRSLDAAYYPQVQGQLWISGRAWLDILSYHPEMPPARMPKGDEPGDEHLQEVAFVSGWATGD